MRTSEAIDGADDLPTKTASRRAGWRRGRGRSLTGRRDRPKLAPEPKGEPIVRVASCTRSATDEAHQPYSLDAQDQRLGSYMASQEGWEHVASFTDQLSGATLERPGIRRALAQARAGRFDILLVYRTDRPSR